MSFVISIIDRQLEAFDPKPVVRNRCVTETALGRFVLKYLLEDNALILRWLRLPSEGALLDGLDVVSNLDVDQYQFQDILLMLINGVVFHEVWFSDRNKLFLLDVEIELIQIVSCRMFFTKSELALKDCIILFKERYKSLVNQFFKYFINITILITMLAVILKVSYHLSCCFDHKTVFMTSR